MEKVQQKRKLGKSDLQVTPIGLGTWQFSRAKGMVGNFWPKLDEQTMHEIVETSLKGGINWFDTAEVYGWGESEKALTNSLKKLGKTHKDVYIATKWFPALRSAKSITKTIEKRLDALNGFNIDLYQIHMPFSFASITAEMKAMKQLVDWQKIKNIGVSNFSASQMQKAHEELQKYGLPLVSNQVKYSLLDRKIETNGVLDMAKNLGITIIAYSPLEQGLLTGKFHKNPSLIKNRHGIRKFQSKFKENGLKKSQLVIDELDKLAEKYHVTASQIALNWLINYHGDTVVAIPGATKTSHAEANTGTMNFQLSQEEMLKLDRISSAYK